jgi:hypothetical protein
MSMRVSYAAKAAVLALAAAASREPHPGPT